MGTENMAKVGSDDVAHPEDLRGPGQTPYGRRNGRGRRAQAKGFGRRWQRGSGQWRHNCFGPSSSGELRWPGQVPIGRLRGTATLVRTGVNRQLGQRRTGRYWHSPDGPALSG